MANTIDVLGDNAVTDSIIDRSITEIVDDALTSIGNYTFQTCSNLATANFPAATSIGSSAFLSCSNLTTVNFPAATLIDSSAFQNCTKLTTANFPAATSIGSSAFNGCTKLTTVDFPAVTTINGSAFNNCSKLITVDFPAATSIGTYTFSTCTNLTKLILRNTEQVATLKGANAFNGATNCIIYVPDALVDSYKVATNWSTYADRIKGLSELPAE